MGQRPISARTSRPLHSGQVSELAGFSSLILAQWLYNSWPLRFLPGAHCLAEFSRKERTHETRIQGVTPGACTGHVCIGSRPKSSSSRRWSNTDMSRTELHRMNNEHKVRK